MTSWFIRTWRIIGKAGDDEKLSSWTNVSVWGSNNMCIISVQLSFLWGGHYEGRPSGWIWEVSSNTRYPSRAQVQYVRTPVLFVGIRRPSIDTRTMVGNMNFWVISPETWFIQRLWDLLRRFSCRLFDSLTSGSTNCHLIHFQEQQAVFHAGPSSGGVSARWQW